MKWLIGIDEAGEKVWVKNAGSILQDFLRFSFKIQEVDSFCKKTFARSCLAFFELAKINTDNLNSSCKEGVRPPLW